MLSDHEDPLARALRRLEPRTTFAELMAERTSGFSFSQDRTRTDARPRLPSQGVVFRAWAGDHWMESATAGLGPREVGEVVEELLRRLPAQLGEAGPAGDPTTGRAERSIETARPPRDVSVDDRARLAKLWRDWAGTISGIRETRVQIADAESERLYLSTAGAFRYQRLTRVRGLVVPIAIEGGRVEYDAVFAGSVGGFELLDAITEERVTETAREAERLLHASAPPAGSMPVLMDPSTTGTFAHESFGHGTEADQMLRDRSFLKPLIGSDVAPPLLSVVDDGSRVDGWGSIFFDDEGHPTERTALIDHGRFAEVLHDRESAAAFGGKPKGNTRRADYLSRPFVRMTNTVVEPGSSTLDELLEEAGDGILLAVATSGIEDPLGGQMQIKVKKARRIQHGELTDRYTSTALSGRVLDVLKAVRGVTGSQDFAMTPGTCGKGHSDQLPVGSGGPYVLTEAIVGPA